MGDSTNNKNLLEFLFLLIEIVVFLNLAEGFKKVQPTKKVPDLAMGN